MATYLKPGIGRALADYYCVHFDTINRVADVQSLDVIVDGQIDLYYKQRPINSGFVIAGIFLSRAEAEEFVKKQLSN